MKYRNLRAGVAAIVWLAAALAAGAAEPPAEVARAVELFDAGDLDAAAEELAAVDGPERPWADHYLGRIAYARAEHDAAIERFAAAVEARPESPLFQRWLGEAYIAKIDTVNAFAKLGLAKKAQAALEEAVRLAPADFEARDALVGFYLNAPPIAGGSQQKAAAQVAELAEIDPALGSALQGRIHLNGGEWAEAEAAYRRALESDAANAEYQYLVGFAQQQQERYDEAVASFEKAIELDPAATAAYYQIGRTAVFAGNHLERGVECLETYLDRPVRPGSPGHEHAWWRLGMLRELRGENELAMAAYRAALAIDPQHDDAKKALAALGR